MKKSKKIIPVVILIAVIAVILSLFLLMPNGETIKAKLSSNDYETGVVNHDTPILGLLLPKGAIKSLTSVKSVNGKVNTLEVLYFESKKASNDFYDSLDKPKEGYAVGKRGKAVFFGSKEAVNIVRWKLWFFN